MKRSVILLLFLQNPLFMGGEGFFNPGPLRYWLRFWIQNVCALTLNLVV